MTPGTIIVDKPAEEAVTEFLANDLIDVRVVFEALASPDSEIRRTAEGRFKAVAAAMAAAIGPPTETPTRKQRIANPPRMIDPRWTHAAVWRQETEMLVVTLSGAQGGAHEVSLCRGAP